MLSKPDNTPSVKVFFSLRRAAQLPPGLRWADSITGLRWIEGDPEEAINKQIPSRDSSVDMWLQGTVAASEIPWMRQNKITGALFKIHWGAVSFQSWGFCDKIHWNNLLDTGTNKIPGLPPSPLPVGNWMPGRNMVFLRPVLGRNQHNSWPFYSWFLFMVFTRLHLRLALIGNQQ